MTEIPSKSITSATDAQIAATDASTAAIATATAANTDSTDSSAPTDDAITVSLARSRARNAQLQNPDEALSSLLNGLHDANSVIAAHGGLDPARVFSLLDDSDDE